MQATSPATARASGEAAARADVDPALVRDLGAFMKYFLHQTGREFYEMVDALDLSLTQLRMLQLLSHDVEESSLKDIADHLHLSLPAVSRAVDGLVQRGLATRSENAEDRRLKTVRATDEALALVDRAVELRLAGIEDFLARLSSRERSRLASALVPIAAREEIAQLCEGGRCSFPPPRRDPADA